MTKDQAESLMTRYSIPIGANFHTLDSFTVGNILTAADEYKYRKPRAANGSRGRYFYAFLNRAVEKVQS